MGLDPDYFRERNDFHNLNVGDICRSIRPGESADIFVNLMPSPFWALL